MGASPLSFASTLALSTLLLHGAAALTACGSGGSGTGAGATTTGSSTTTATGGATTTTSSSTTQATGGGSTTTTTTATGDGGTGGSTGDAGGDGGGDLCTQTGGTVTMISCCASAGDFPSTCSIGACSCAPGSSQTVASCNCPGSECYDPTNGCMNQP